MIIASALIAALMAIAAFHVFWGLGGLWPGRSQQELVDIVVGKGDRMPGLLPCFAVAVALLGVAYAAMAQLGLLPWPRQAPSPAWPLAAACFLFAARGIGSWLPVVARTHSATFVRLDRRIYSPLCLALALACGLVAAR